MKMTNIINNSIFSLDYYPEHSLMVYKASEQTINLSEDSFKEGFSQTNFYVKKYRPQFFLSDSREQLYIIPPEIQQWITENVYPVWAESGIKKLAILIPSDLLTQLSLWQTTQNIEENIPKLKYEIKYFDDEKAAWGWLI